MRLGSVGIARAGAMVVAIALWSLGFAASAQTASAPMPGEAIYKTHCAACHDNPETMAVIVEAPSGPERHGAPPS